MFRGCSKLNYIKMLATDISASNCLYNWVSGVSPTGTFVKNISATWTTTGYSGVPSGWTVKSNYTPIECISLEISANDVSGYDTTTMINWTAKSICVDDNDNIVGEFITSGVIESEPFE
jgi:hypothetical protein